MPYKNFTPSQLTSSEVQSYLMNQSVMVFANSAARSAALTLPTEGMLTYLQDVDRVEFWSGSEWLSLNRASGTGSVLQVVVNQPAFGNQQLDSFTETLFINPLATITPKKSTSRILIFFTFGAYPNNFEDYYSLYIRRGAVGAANKIASNGGVYGDWTHNFRMNTAASYREAAHQQYSIHAWDTASTTSQITYVLTGNRYVGAGVFVLWSGALNRVTLMEIDQ